MTTNKAGEQPTITQALKPCPFCGSRAIGTRTLAGVEFWSVECMTCTAKVDDPNSKKDAAKVWNTRTTSLAAQVACPSCHGLNISCPEGCGRDPVTGELDGSTLKLAAQNGLVEALEKAARQFNLYASGHEFNQSNARAAAIMCEDALSAIKGDKS